MSSSVTVVTPASDEIDLITLWRSAWRLKWYLIIGTVLGGLIALVLALRATPLYKAEVVVTPARENGMSGGSSLATQLGGLANLAGVNIGGSGGAAQEARATLESHRLVSEFIERNNLLPEILRGSKQTPSVWFGVRRFRDSVLSIRDDAQKGTTIVAIEWTDPAVAARWANTFVSLANELVRTRALEDSKRNIGYLNGQLAQTNVVELRKVLYNLIESETKTQMLANGRSEYAFTVIDPAVAPQIRSSPQRTVMVILGIVVGLFLGGLAAFLRSAWLRHQEIARP